MLVATDLLAPKGRVEGGSFFPDLSSTDLAARLNEYIAQGYTLGTEKAVPSGFADSFAYHYAHYRAFEAVYLSIIANPLSSATPEGGSASFTLAQAEEFARMAQEEKDAYTALIPVEAAAIATRPRGTTEVPNKFVW